MSQHDEAMKKWADEFHAHLDICPQCEQHPFELCVYGARLLMNAPRMKAPGIVGGGGGSMTELSKIRKAVADYMHSEGCSCCQNIKAHEQHEATLAKLLRVPKYSDGSGYDFGKFRTKEKP